MKETLVYLVVFFFNIGCAQDAPKPKTDTILGKWNSYEWNSADGEIHEGTKEIFLTYYTGLDFQEDQTFSMFMDQDNNGEHEAWLLGERPAWKIQGGTLLKLKFATAYEGIEDFESFEIEKLTIHELWLRFTSNDKLYIKFKKQP